MGVGQERPPRLSQDLRVSSEEFKSCSVNLSISEPLSLRFPRRHGLGLPPGSHDGCRTRRSCCGVEAAELGVPEMKFGEYVSMGAEEAKNLGRCPDMG